MLGDVAVITAVMLDKHGDLYLTHDFIATTRGTPPRPLPQFGESVAVTWPVCVRRED